MNLNHRTISTLAWAAAALLSTSALAPVLAADVTAQRLLNTADEPQNWLSVHRDYNSDRYSPLDQINRDTVKNLHVAFATAIGGNTPGGILRTSSQQATPLVNDGMMYVVDGWSVVYGIDVSKGNAGRIAWVMDPGEQKDNVYIAANRGVALYKNFVLSVDSDGHLNWTKADTGELVNSVQIDDPKNGYSLTAAPLVIGDKVIVGGSGGDRGARDHIDALNADTGAALWRTYSIPAPGQPGSETWKDSNSAWEHGGGAFWQTGSYDPDTNLTIWGTGNPVPMFDPEYRPGDNLFTNSTVAFNVDNGDMQWYFQYTPGDYLDYDEIGSQILGDMSINGENRKTVMHFGRNGFFYTLDRTNGQFINAAQYVEKLNWTAGIDPKTGKPVEYDPSKDLQSYALGNDEGRRAQGAVTACPNLQGGVNYFPTAYSPKTQLAYGAGLEAGCAAVTADANAGLTEIPGAGRFFMGGSGVTTERMLGGIAAMNPATGKQDAKHMFDYADYAGVMATGGGLVFTPTVDGTLWALDDKTLDVLWSFNMGTGMGAAPMTYAVDGKQYIAVVSGNNSAGPLAKSPEMADLQNSPSVWVFSL